ncbi:ABC transporter permease [Pseudophaeobacter profundi]|uniref:ABC transporter permease n=1 Tax=Pseudophaeobacter profundi TaxID=3034152 RepID=UPI00242F1C70|nr:ABC transporter permease [Pseudophaeobacter profundi]
MGQFSVTIYRHTGSVLSDNQQLVFLLLYAPILSAVLFSFSADRFPSLDMSGFSTKWYAQVLTDRAMLEALGNSLTVAGITALIATALGFAAAYADYRFRFFGQKAVLALALLPPTVPLVILGLAMLAFFSRIGIAGTLAAVVAAHVVIAAPFAMAVCRLRLAQLDETLETAAQNLGALPHSALARIVLPHTLPAILAAFLITFAVSFDEYVISWFTGGLNQTIPVAVLTTLQGQVDPTIHVIGTLSFSVTLTLVLIALAVVLRQSGGAMSKEETS